MKINSTLIQSTERRIKYRKFRENGNDHYHIGVWVEGDSQELDEIEKVQYKLHPSFKKQLRESCARDNDFSVTFWAWGTFNIEVTIFKFDGTETRMDYELKFDLPADNGTNYIDVSDY